MTQDPTYYDEVFFTITFVSNVMEFDPNLPPEFVDFDSFSDVEIV